MDRKDAAEYLKGISQAIGHPNAVLDLCIPGGGEYYNVLDVGASRAMAKELSPQKGLDSAAKGWERTTKRLDRKRQRRLYIDSLKGVV